MPGEHSVPDKVEKKDRGVVGEKQLNGSSRCEAGAERAKALLGGINREISRWSREVISPWIQPWCDCCWDPASSSGVWNSRRLLIS